MAITIVDDELNRLSMELRAWIESGKSLDEAPEEVKEKVKKYRKRYRMLKDKELRDMGVKMQKDE